MDRGPAIGTFVALVVAAGGLGCAWMGTDEDPAVDGPGRSGQPAPEESPGNAERPDAAELGQAPDDAGAASGLVVDEIEAGSGSPVVTQDSEVVLLLRGMLADGTVVQGDEGPLGPWPVRGLIEGLARGLDGMTPGARRRITIPPELAYGDETITDPTTGDVRIPAGATLVYEVEVVEVVESDEPAATPTSEAGQR